MKLNTILSPFIALAFTSTLATSSPLSTAFTYQGRLSDGTNFANGLYELRFSLYDAPTGGSQIGPALTNTYTPVSAGLFGVSLDFGAGVFNGTAYWLALGVRTNGASTDFTLLEPRQPITATPYALFALSLGPRPGATGLGASIGGGSANVAASDFATVSGGSRNQIEAGAYNATIGGGEENLVRSNAFDARLVEEPTTIFGLCSVCHDRRRG